MKKIITFALMAMIGIVSNIAIAKTIPKERREDGRIREVWYNENQIVEIPTSFGYAITIELGNESVKTIIAGDTIGWQITPQGNRVFIKPAEKPQKGMESTNVTIITEKRNYYLHLYIAPRNNAAFVIRYRYDKPPQPPTESIETTPNTKSVQGSELKKNYKNFNYGFSGDKKIVVQKVWDDGQFTYFKFDPRKPLPAIYKVNSRGRDELVNTRKEGEYIVVEAIGELFTLKDGDLHKCVKNQALLPIYKDYSHEPDNGIFKQNGR